MPLFLEDQDPKDLQICSDFEDVLSTWSNRVLDYEKKLDFYNLYDILQRSSMPAVDKIKRWQDVECGG